MILLGSHQHHPIQYLERDGNCYAVLIAILAGNLAAKRQKNNIGPINNYGKKQDLVNSKS
jgi:hypothetical protein